MAQLILHAGEDISVLGAAARRRAHELDRPAVVAIDGRSGAGKSTLAAKLSVALDAPVLDGDDFFAGGVSVRWDEPEDRARDCIDWRRQRPVLEALRAGRAATYLAFDWQAFDGRLKLEPTRVQPGTIIIFEGVYSARPELADLIDLRVLLHVSAETRGARLLAREGSLGRWERQWHEAEDWYLQTLAPPSHFDIIVDE